MRKLIVLPALVSIFAAAVAAQSPSTFRSGTSMVALNVTVTDGRKLVTGLGESDFEVYEDGVRQPLKFFETSQAPLDLILLLDASSSMRDKMSMVHDAARSFMKVLRPGDRGAVVAFADRVQVLQTLTEDASIIESAIGTTRAMGSTALNNALYISLKEFGRGAMTSGDVRRQAIAVLSDGDDTASIISFDDVVELARKTGVAVYTIALSSDLGENPQVGRFSNGARAMRTLARETGAQAFFPGSVHELRGIYSRIAEELESQYSLAYTPTNSRADGTFRRISVRIPSDPSLRPRTRTGYTAVASAKSGDNSGFRLQ